MTAVTVAFGLAAVLVWGDAVLAATDGATRRRPAVERLALAWLAGSVLSTWSVCLALWSGLGLRLAVALVTVMGGGAWLAASHRRRPIALGAGPRPRRPLRAAEVAAVVVIAAVLLEVALLALAGPSEVWDAWVNFASRARVLLVDDGLSAAVHADPSRLATNLDYPLMLPLGEAWLAVTGGVDLDRAVGVVTLAHALALVGVLWAAVRRRLSRTAALGVTATLVLLPLFDRMAAAGVADVPLAALVVAVLALSADDLAAGGGWLLPAVLAAGLPWLKLEGWVWWVLALAALGISVGRRPPGRLSWGLAALLPGGSWQLFLATAGSARFAFEAPTLDLAWRHLDRLPAIAVAAARHLAAADWSLLWLALPVAVALRPRDVFRAASGRALAAIVWFLGTVAVAFVWSRFDPWQAHLADSIVRLAWQAAPLALWWLAVRACQLGWLPAAERP